MKLHYKKHLKSFARTLRKSGNLSEVLLWKELKKDKLGCRFLRQRPIGKYIVDFYCHSLNLAIEIDGAASHDAKVGYDENRQQALEVLGIRVIRFADAAVRYNISGVIEAIKAEILRLAKISRPAVSGTPSLQKKECSPPPLRKEE